jgi:hypothetical protein
VHDQSHAFGGEGVDGRRDGGGVVDHEHVPRAEMSEDGAKTIVSDSTGTHGGDQQADIGPVMTTVLRRHRSDQRRCHLEIERGMEESHQTGNSSVAV